MLILATVVTMLWVSSVSDLSGWRYFTLPGWGDAASLC